MRKVLILAMLLGVVGVYAAASQEKMLERPVEITSRNESLTSVLERIAEEFELAFVYSANDIPADHKVTLTYKGDLKGLLDQALDGTDIQYFESNRQVILKKADQPKPAPGYYQTSTAISLTPGFRMPRIDTAKVDLDSIAAQRGPVFSDTLDFSGHTHPETYDSYKGYPVRPAHIGLIYPISTNGMDAKEYVNNVSFHLIGGVSAGVHGITFSGITNYDLHFVEGVQFAGIVNISGGYVEGLQFAGITNITDGDVFGFQFAGIANINEDTVRGGQFAGITNVNTSMATGAQFAGIANVNSYNVDGAQFAGITNVTPGHHRGAQVAGITNVAGSLEGAQIAGIANVSSGKTNGFQMAGIVNVGGNVKGSQLGLFNVADSVSGVSIGFLSFVKHGYKRVEISGSEALHTQLAFKIGVQKFYNILALGYHFSGADPFEYGDQPTWAYGYGIGSEFDIGRVWRMNMDLTAFDVIEKENTFTEKKLNILGQFRLNFGAQLGRRFTIAFGPSFNVMVSELQGNDLGTIGSDLPPYTVYDETHGDVNTKLWPGFNLALRF